MHRQVKRSEISRESGQTGATVDYHLERELRLQTAPEHERLYAWAINEIDAEGRQIGHDQIPWNWSLYFTAASCVLGDSIEIESKLQTEKTTPVPPEVVQPQFIRVQLRPGLDDGGLLS